MENPASKAQILRESLDNQQQLTLSDTELKSFANKIKAQINEYCATQMDNTHRKHMGASIMGEECQRYIWLVHRWALKSVFVDYKTGEDVTGRMLRLFGRGHREEPILVEYLKAIGWNVNEYSPFEPLIDGKPQQFRLEAHNGHFGGSLDGITIKLADISIPLLLEMKTYNKKRFMELVKNGVSASAHKYATQCHIYGYAYKLQYALFIAACKDDDDLHVEILRLDWNKGKDKVDRAGYLLNLRRPPAKIALSEANYKCRLCTMVPVCHRGEPAEKNCRTCRFSVPIMDEALPKAWGCEHYKAVIPLDILPKGCDAYETVID